MPVKSTLPNDSRKAQDDLHNPEKEYFDREFQEIGKHYDESADPSREDANADRRRLMDSENPSEVTVGATSPSADPEDPENGFWNGGDKGQAPPDKKEGGRTRQFFFGTRRRALISMGGGLGGFGIIGIIAFIFTSGPLEIIHLAQNLHDFHFSHNESFSDDRTGKLIRYVRSGDVGETRLGYLGSKMTGNMVADLKGIGINFEKGFGGTLKALSFDTTSEHSPYKGLSNEEIKTKVTALGFKGGFSEEGGKLLLSPDGFLGNRQLRADAVKALGKKGLSAAIRTRILGKFFGVTWHPLTIAERKAGATVAEKYKAFKDERATRINNGDPTATYDTKKAENDGKPLTPGEDADIHSTVNDPATVKTRLGNIANSKGGKITGGLAAAVGIVCTLRGVADHIGIIRYVKVVQPAIRMGMEAIIIGYQIESGQDIDPERVSFVAQNLNEYQNGKVVSSWDQADSLQAENGKTGGNTSGEGTLELISAGIPDWLSWTQAGVFSGMCSTAGQAVTGILSIGISVFGAGVASSIIQLGASALILPKVVDLVTDLLAGNAVDPNASGAAYGNIVNYGSRLAANSTSLASGGVALTGTQVAALDREQRSEDVKDMQSKSIADRLFNASDSKSLFGRMIDGANTIIPHNLSSIIPSFTNSLHLVAAGPQSLSTSLFAANTSQFDYGFPEYGTSLADQDNPAVNDPYKNADDVAQILDSPTGKLYVAKAADCFGVDIVKATEPGTDKELWDVVPTNKGSNGNDINPYSDSGSDEYDTEGCAKGNIYTEIFGAAKTGQATLAADTDEETVKTNWLKLRFFIADTGAMEGYACFNGDQTSCDNDGFTDGGTDTGNGGGNTGDPPNAEGWTWPISSKDWNGPFGYNVWGSCSIKCRHEGVDISGTGGKNALAAHDGKVVSVEHVTISGSPGGDCKIFVLIQATGDTGSNLWFAYQHLGSASVKPGQDVKAGSVIGVVDPVGPTGGCGSGAHLHFSIEKTAHISAYADGAGKSDKDMPTWPPLCFLDKGSRTYGPDADKTASKAFCSGLGLPGGN